MVFAGRGEMPQVVIDTWRKMYGYFTREDISHKITFMTDF
jgi:hypothetical protein